MHEIISAKDIRQGDTMILYEPIPCMYQVTEVPEHIGNKVKIFYTSETLIRPAEATISSEEKVRKLIMRTYEFAVNVTVK